MEKEDIRKKTKAILRAVLLSAPRGVLARNLQKEYSNLTGKYIDYRSLGYPSLDSFLSSVPDVIRSGFSPTGEPAFFAVSDESTAHIAKLVAKQKKPKVRAGPNRPPVLPKQKQTKFFASRSPSSTFSSSIASNRKVVRPPLKPAPVLRNPSTASRTIYSAKGHGKCDVDLSKSRPVVIKGFSEQITMDSRTLVRMTGYVAARPQLKSRIISGGRQQKFGNIILKDALPKGYSVLCLFVGPQWDVERNTDFMALLNEGDCIVIFGYPETINTPKYIYKKSLALKVVAFESYTSNRVVEGKPPPMKHVTSPVAGGVKSSSSSEDIEVLLSERRNSTLKSLSQENISEEDIRKLENEVLEVIKDAEGGMWWKQVAKLYKEKYKKDIPDNAQAICAQTSSIEVDDTLTGSRNPRVTVALKRSPKKEVSYCDHLPEMKAYDECDTYSVIVTHVESPASFYGHQLDLNSDCRRLVEEMTQYYTGRFCPPPATSPQMGSIYACQFAADGLWYRVKLTRAEEPCYRVFYVDYGNEEVVERSNLRPLKTDFSKLPPLAIKLSISETQMGCEGETWSKTAIQYFTDKVFDHEVKVVFSGEKVNDQCHRVFVVDYQLVQSMLEEKIAKLPPDRVVSLPKDDLFSCDISMIYSPVCFYVQTREAYARLAELEERMKEHFTANKEVPITKPFINMLAVTADQSTPETRYHRVKITDVLQDGYVAIQYVDYGNEEEIEQKSVSFLPPQFHKLPFQAVKCSLRGMSDFLVLEMDKVFEYFFEYQEKEGLLAKVIESFPSHDVLEVLDKEALEKGSINKQLMSLGTPISLLVPKLPPPGGKASVNLTDVSLEGVVSLQVHGPNLQSLEELMNLINAKLGQKVTASDYMGKVTEGVLCCAKQEDQQWYRVKVVKVLSGDVLEVEFIDSGQKAELNKRNLRKPLSSPLFTLPAQALKCTIDKLPPQGGAWSEAAVSQVFQTVEGTAISIEVVRVSGSELPVVKLLYELDGAENDISSVLLRKPQQFGLEPVQDTSSPDPDGAGSEAFDEFTFAIEEEEEEVGESKDQHSSGDGLSSHTRTTGSNKISSPSTLQLTALAQCVDKVLPLSLQPYLPVPVSLSYVESPSNFWITPPKQLQVYKVFHEALDSYCSEQAKNAPNPKENCIFAIEVSSNHWERASFQRNNVCLIDAGNSVKHGNQKCLELPELLSSVPPLAVKSSLLGAPRKTSSKVNAQFSLMEGQLLFAVPVGELLTSQEKTVIVELISTKRPNEDILVSQSLSF